MFKLMFGLFIIGMIFYIVYQVRKENKRFKGIQDADDRINEAQDKLAEFDVRDELVDLQKQVHKRGKKLSEKQDKLDAKTSKE